MLSSLWGFFFVTCSIVTSIFIDLTLHFLLFLFLVLIVLVILLGFFVGWFCYEAVIFRVFFFFVPVLSYLKLVFHIVIFFIDGFCLHQELKVLKSNPFENLTNLITSCSLWNICFTDHCIYVSIIVITIPSAFSLWYDFAEFNMQNRICLPFQDTRDHQGLLCGFYVVMFILLVVTFPNILHFLTFLVVTFPTSFSFLAVWLLSLYMSLVPYNPLSKHTSP